MKRILTILLIALIALTLPASADSCLTAVKSGSTIHVAWTVEDAETLTLYESGWPVACVTACGRSRTFTGMKENGNYTVRLRTAHGCINAGVVAGDATVRPVETASPTAQPTVKPVATPVATPAATPTAMPTATPTVQVTLPPATSAPAPGNSSLAARVVELVNEDRAKYGAGALSVSQELTRAACVRAEEISRSFSHTRPDGSAWNSVSGAVSAENIAMGYQTAEKAEAAWLSSEGHRRNMLNAAYTKTGVCAFSFNGVIYWVQLFGR